MHYKFGMSTWEIQAQLQLLRDYIHQSNGHLTRPSFEELKDQTKASIDCQEGALATRYLQLAAYFLGLHHELTREKDTEFPS